MKEIKQHHSICRCYSPEHTVHWHYDTEDEEVWFYVNLQWNQSFFKRVWHAVKYVFGYRSVYGHFDCFILSPTELNKLVRFLSEKHTETLELKTQIFRWVCDNPGVDGEDVARHFKLNDWKAHTLVGELLDEGLLSF